MAFGHVQGATHTIPVSSTSDTLTLGANPTRGNLVVVSVMWYAVAPTGITLKDANNITYLATTNTPSVTQAVTGVGNATLGFFYLLSAPANASKTLNLAWTGGNHGDWWAEEFSTTGGAASFDKDVAAALGSTGTNVNTPTLTPTNSGELLFAASVEQGTISAPTAGGTLGIWTGAAGGISVNGTDAEYVMSAGIGAIAPSFTQTTGSQWYCMQAAFIWTAGTIYMLGHT